MTHRLGLSAGAAFLCVFAIDACSAAEAGHAWPIVRAVSGGLFLGILFLASRNRRSLRQRDASPRHKFSR